MSSQTCNSTNDFMSGTGQFYQPDFITNKTMFPIDIVSDGTLMAMFNIEGIMNTMNEIDVEEFDLISYVSIIIALSFVLKQKYNVLKKENVYIIFFMISTIYRSWNISDEGAFLCYKTATIYNSCFSGRVIATFGEFNILNWILLQMNLDKMPKIYYMELFLCFIAETCSWFGCILRNSRFFCIEYLIWNILLAVIVCCNLKSGKYFARFTFLLVMIFNFVVEIPHFYHYKLERETSLFLSTHDQYNPVWKDRIMFFIAYYNLIPLYLLSTAFSSK